MEERIILAIFGSWILTIPVLWGIVSAIKQERYESIYSLPEREWERHTDFAKVAFWPLLLVFSPFYGLYKLFFYITSKVKSYGHKKG